MPEYKEETANAFNTDTLTHQQEQHPTKTPNAEAQEREGRKRGGGENMAGATIRTLFSFFASEFVTK